METIIFILLLVRSRVIRVTLDDLWEGASKESLSVTVLEEDPGTKWKSDYFFVSGLFFACKYERCRPDPSWEKIRISMTHARGEFTALFRNGKLTELGNGLWSSHQAKDRERFLLQNILAAVQNAVALYESALARGISPEAV